MNDEQFTVLTALLTEIRDALKAGVAPQRTTTKRDDSPREPALTAPDKPWARFGWPQFTNKAGKRRAVTLGESVAAGNYGLKDLKWWADNYEPREYQGSIAAKDIEFRKHLTAAQAWVDAQGTADHATGTPPAPRKPDPTDAQLANQGGADEPDIPF